MAIIRRSKTAIHDIDEIWDYIADQDQVAAADAVLASFEKKLELLSQHPYVGVARPDLRKRLRSVPVGTYMIFYKPIRGGIQLVRLIHSSRDITRIFKRR